jgi:hypothetical protein
MQKLLRRGVERLVSSVRVGKPPMVTGKLIVPVRFGFDIPMYEGAAQLTGISNPPHWHERATGSRLAESELD